MCNPACLRFVTEHLREEEVKGKDVLEVGALDVNGSVRASVEHLRPASYLGVDIAAGPGVDEICDISDLAGRFGKDRFDLVVSTELLEHVYDWRRAVSNLKAVLKPHGTLLVTARSKGFHYHGYPYDFWRYDVRDIRVIFADLSLEAIEKDSLKPGVFVKARKAVPFVEKDLGSHALYSIIAKRRCLEIREFDFRLFILCRRLRRFLGRLRPARRKRSNGS